MVVRVLHGDDRLDAPRDRAGIAAEDVLLHAGFKEGDPRSAKGVALLRLSPAEFE